MRHSLSVLAVASLVLVPVAASGQGQSPASKTAKSWTPARTADGQPDLQGTWVNFDSTPFEAPGGPQLPAAPAGVGPAANWADHDSPMPAKRASMVVDPPDGKVPVMAWAEAKRDY